MNNNLLKPARVQNQFILRVGENFENKAVPVQTVTDINKVSSESMQTEKYIKGRTSFIQIMQREYLPWFPRPKVINIEQAKIPMILVSTNPLKTITWNSREHTVNDLIDTILEQGK